MPWLWGPVSAMGLGWAALTLALDQGSKWWMLEVYGIQDRGVVAVAPFLNLVYVKNRGISYGLFQLDHQIGQWLLAGFAGVVMLALAVWLARDVTSKLVAVS
ncbi:MAG TPA: signal peptidase II, partial [Hyphomicrobiaceae bacterium]|nr:signal peptidase II [Hyphomicrobiaceae bacterium]